MENHRDANHPAILSVYHKDFLGWPDPEPRPANKSDMPEYLRRNFPEPTNGTLEIERGGIQVVGDVAINHYTVHVTTVGENGEAHKASARITHTWVREDGRWQLLGGMSNE